MVYNIRYLETVLNFSKKFFLGLMYPFSCFSWLDVSVFVCALGENASKTHPKSSHDKFKTASKYIPYCNKHFSRNSDLHLHPVLSSFDTLPV